MTSRVGYCTVVQGPEAQGPEETVDPVAGIPFEDEIAGLLLEASFDLLAKGGWGNFSLRAVADSIGAAGSAASHRFGDRAGLVAAVCDAAVQREQREMDRFLPKLQVDTDDELAAVLYEWLEQRVRWNRKQARACSELLLVSYRDGAFGSFSRRWLEVCQRMIARLHPALDPEAATAVASYLSVEIAYWLLLADDPLFRLASAEGLRRIVRLASRSGNELPVFWMQRSQELPDARRLLVLTGTKQRIIEATMGIILESGVQAITHREIAKHSGASLSSLTYHFESLSDLIRQGFQMLFAPVLPGAGAGEGPEALEAAAPSLPNRAVVGYELVLQALRDPFLAPLAATVRRQLGAGLFGELSIVDDPRLRALCEAGAVLETAYVLAGKGEPPLTRELLAAC